MIKVDQYNGSGSILDLTADGSKVASSDGHQIRVAPSDGSGGKTILSGRNIANLRITAAGDRVFFLASGDAPGSCGFAGCDPAYQRGLWVINSDGTGMLRIAGPTAVAAVLGVTANDVQAFANGGSQHTALDILFQPTGVISCSPSGRAWIDSWL